MHISRFVTAVVLLVSLTACQTLDLAPQGGDWLNDETIFAQRQADFEAQTAWQYSAKVGVVADQLQEQANIVWNYADQTNNVRLFGPLGAGQIKLQFDQYGVQLSDSKGVLHQGFVADGVSAQSLLTDITKLPIPVDALVYWLFVLPDPDHGFSYQLNPMGQVVTLRQLGWQISFSDYREYAGNILPRRVTATRDNQPQAVTVKLVTKEWQWPL